MSLIESLKNLKYSCSNLKGWKIIQICSLQYSPVKLLFCLIVQKRKEQKGRMIVATYILTSNFLCLKAQISLIITDLFCFKAWLLLTLDISLVIIGILLHTHHRSRPDHVLRLILPHLLSAPKSVSIARLHVISLTIFPWTHCLFPQSALGTLLVFRRLRMPRFVFLGL